MKLGLFSTVMLMGGATALGVTEDIPVGFIPPTWVTQEVRKALSPQGRFVLLNASGVVRVTDSDDKIAEVHRLLARLQNAPASITLKIDVIDYGTKTVETRVDTPSGNGDEFPYPHRFLPPKIVQNARGGFIIVPSQPTDFRTRSTGTSSVATQTVTKTEQTKQMMKRLTGTSIPGKPATIPVLARVDDVAGLRALAARLGAIPDREPEWTSAATELLIRTEIAGSELHVTITPQIVLPAASPTDAPRRVSLKACAGAIPISRALPSPIGKLPKTDPEFYRLFMDLPTGAPNDVVALNLKSEVRYLGAKPPE